MSRSNRTLLYGSRNSGKQNMQLPRVTNCSIDQLMMTSMVLFTKNQKTYLENREDRFVVEFRDQIQHCLQTIFKVVLFEFYFNRAVAVIFSDPNDFAAIEPWIFLATSTITSAYFPVELMDILQIILDFPQNAPSSIIQTSCVFLKTFLDNCVSSGREDDIAETTIISIYRWLARFHFRLIQDGKQKEGSHMNESNERLLVFKLLNEPNDLFDEKTVLRSVATLLREPIHKAAERDEIRKYLDVLNFHTRAIIQELQINQPGGDSILFIFYTITSLIFLLEDIKLTHGYDYENTGIVYRAWEMCFEVFKCFDHDEEMCGKTCVLLTKLISVDKGDHLDEQSASELLLQFYRSTSFECFVILFQAIHNQQFCDGQGAKMFSKLRKAFYYQIFHFFEHKDPIHDSNLLKRLLIFSREILYLQYDDMLHFLDIGKVIPFATDALLSEDENMLNECRDFFDQLFLAKPCCDRTVRPKTDSIAGRFFRAHAPQIVKNCVEVISSPRKIYLVRVCGSLLHIMNDAEKILIPRNLNITEALIRQVCKDNSGPLCLDQKMLENFIKLINVSHRNEAGDMAASINSGLYTT
ncbi:hypothetical protein RF11_08052 [Thelohanellus kitauei]|uniref:Uncharacterized protein n=1 Tax=Thelohanellus kitauei TaxID=669202 RepID=A0A0C2J380_THEKT|nr:hypothetical protein RF11_08052 [Thelohanellus kitauei]